MKRCVALSAALTLLALPAGAGRPLNIDDAGTIGHKNIQLEAGVGYAGDSDCDHLDLPLVLTYGLLSRLDVGVGFGGQFEERIEAAGGRVTESDIGDLVAGAKWNALEEKGWWPAQTLAPAVKFPTASRGKDMGSGETDYDLTYVASKSLGEKAGAHLNAGYSWIGDSDDEDADNEIHYGAALDFQLLETVQLVGEMFAVRPDASGAETTVFWNAGLRWDVLENLTLDAAAGTRISGDGSEDWIATAGLTWVMGLEKQTGRED